MSKSFGLRAVLLRSVMVVCGLISVFFVFYTIRLLFVTQGLTVLREGGGGTYIGAAAFPVLAIVFGFAAWRLSKVARADQSKENSQP